jgi:hypothetical protein
VCSLPLTSNAKGKGCDVASSPIHHHLKSFHLSYVPYIYSYKLAGGCSLQINVDLMNKEIPLPSLKLLTAMEF